MNIQVDKSHYDFDRYVGPDRWASYHSQIKETLTMQPQSVLEVGVGDGVYRDYLKAHTDIQYRSLDIATDLAPDVLGSVDAIPLPDAAADIVVAFEVLEHLPFEKFPQALKEMSRVAKKGIIVSLPHFGPPIKFLLKLPFLPEIKVAWKVPYPKTHVFNGEHYWEIGKNGYPLSRIKTAIAQHLTIKNDYVPFENQYHHFFVCYKV